MFIAGNVEKRWIHRLIAIAVLCGVSGGISGCNVRKPSPETPAPKSEVFSKNFFVNADGKPKTFMLGMAPETEMGASGEWAFLHAVPVTDHVNVIFEVTEKALIAKQVNPSLLDQPEKWESVLRIPIRRHFYIENAKDDYGRDTNKVIENSDRSHWSARSHIELDLEQLRFMKAGGINSANLPETRLAMEDLEVDAEKSFIGFTINQNILDASEVGVRVRVNLLAFEHNPEFQKTPFSSKNYKYFNVLQYTGKRIDGQFPVLYAGHWDFNKEHKIYLNNVPEKYVPLVKGVVEEWNKTLRKVGALTEGQSGFIPVVEKLKYKFDMRYPTIQWVSDKRISAHSPLGVGYAHMDVRNGEILWGGITIYGGEVENYIKGSMTVAEGLGKTEKSSLKRFFQKILPSTQSGALALPKTLTETEQILSTRMAESFFKQNMSEIKQLAREIKIKDGKLDDKSVLESISPDLVRQMMSQMQQLHLSKSEHLQRQFGDVSSSAIFRKLFLQGRFNSEEEEDAVSSSTRKAVAKTQEENLERLTSSTRFCGDQRFIDIGDKWASAAAESKRNTDDIIESLFKDLVMHEYGHFLGLGHNFKENILPVAGTVPEKYREELVKAHKDGMKNYSTVMGYKNARTDILTAADQVKPGPHDELLLRYLYKQEYSVFKKGAQDFEFEKVPADGMLPAVGGKSQGATTYFPQCNDWTASLGTDPFCNRWDRGSSATELVQNNVTDLTQDLVRTLNAFSDQRGVNPDIAEFRLWNVAFFHLSRIRLFYDYMRREFEKQINNFRQNEEALFEFAQCRSSKGPQTAVLKEAFEKYPLFKDLCIANSIALDALKEILEKDARDLTKLNHKDAIFPGGISAGEAGYDYGQVFGTWKELGAFPLKYVSLYTLMSPTPLSGQIHFSDPQYGYSYSSLYPFQFTETVAGAVIKNLDFATLGKSDTTRMGQTVASLGWMNQMHAFNNDGVRFPKQYISKIRNQSNFDLGYAAVVLKAVRNRDNLKMVERFNGTVYDFMTDKSFPTQKSYVLPGGQVVALAEGMFLFPVSKLQMYSDDEGYVMAYRVTYNRENDDKLSESGLRAKLKNEYNRVLEPCLSSSNGLDNYFTKGTDFTGFVLPPGATQEEIYQQFLKSVKSEYDQYYTKTKARPETCLEALRGLELIVSTAAMSNGYWLPETLDFLLK